MTVFRNLAPVLVCFWRGVMAVVALILVPCSVFFVGQICSGQSVTIEHVSVVDIVGKRILSDQTIQVVDGRILSLESSSEKKRSTQSQIIDATGLFAYPSLFDSHVHLNEPERDSLAMIANGVLYARDMGGQTTKRVMLKQRATRGELNGLQLAVTGTVLDGKPPIHPWATGCDTPDEGRQAVRALKKAGVDQIKVYALLKPDVYRAIANEAKSVGLPVVGHIPDSITVKEAMQAGQQSVEHLTRMETLFDGVVPLGARPTTNEAFAGGFWANYERVSDDNKKRLFADLKSSGLSQCPTLVLYLGQTRTTPDERTKAAWLEYSDPSQKPWWESEIPSQWLGYGDSLRSSLPAISLAIREMHEAGVPLLIGTDLSNLGTLPGFSVHQEMLLWQSAGIPAVDVLRYATIAPAQFLKCEQDYGSIESGKGANFVLTRLNPIENIEHASEIESVVVGGKYLDRKALNAMLANVKRIGQSKQSLDTSKIELRLSNTLEKKLSYSYQQWPSGGERFRNSLSSDGLQFESLIDFGGWGVPLLVSARGSPSGQLQQVKLESITKIPSVIELTLDGESIKTQISLGDSIVSEQVSPKGKEFFLLSWALIDYQLDQLQLKEDESTTISMQTWNAADQRLDRVDCKLTRRKDEELEWNSIKENCKVYVWITEPPADRIAHKVWITFEGRLLKAIRQEESEVRSVLAIP